jgi:hypothetical protein
MSCFASRKWKREQAKSDYAHTFTFVNPGLSGLAVLSQRLGMGGNSNAAAANLKNGDHGVPMGGGAGTGKLPPGYRLNPGGGNGINSLDSDRTAYASSGYMYPDGNPLLGHLGQNVYAVSFWFQHITHIFADACLCYGQL